MNHHTVAGGLIKKIHRILFNGEIGEKEGFSCRRLVSWIHWLALALAYSVLVEAVPDSVLCFCVCVRASNITRLFSIDDHIECVHFWCLGKVFR